MVSKVVTMIISVVLFQRDRTTLYKRFPHIPRAILRKAYKAMASNALSGKYLDVNLSNEEVIENVFLNEVAKIYASQSLQKL